MRQPRRWSGESPRAGSSGTSSDTTRMCAAILPIVCPQAAVNAPKYDSFSSSRNASIGTGGSSCQSPIVEPGHAQRRIEHDEVDREQDGVIGEPGGHAPRAGSTRHPRFRRPPVHPTSRSARVGSLDARSDGCVTMNDSSREFERQRGTRREAPGLPGGAEPRLFGRPAHGERGTRCRRELDQRLVVVLRARREQRICRLGTSGIGGST